MTVYFDTGLITKWYLPERDSPAALGLLRGIEPPALLTHLHRLELANAWNLKVFRQELPFGTVRRALETIAKDIATGVWRVPGYDFESVYRRAEEMSLRHCAELGTRTLDVLHVAAAVELGAEQFFTGDKRQAAMAEAVGLDVVRFGEGGR